MCPSDHPAGVPVVLSADRTLLADYPTLLDGMTATVQTTVVPAVVMRRLLAPPMPASGARAARAPLGLRRLEAALRAGGYGPDDVAVVPPERLAEVIGPATRVAGVSSGDPLGAGMTSTTMAAVAGGQPYTQWWFATLCQQVRALRRRAPRMRVLAGGPGAWQLEQDPVATAALGIDTVCVGYGEREAAALVNRLLAGADAEPIVRFGRTSERDIPPIVGAAGMGVVEISRGCGRGCGFCTLADEPAIHLGVEHVLADAATNIAGGAPAISLIGEDLFRYGSPTVAPAPGRLMDLLSAVRGLGGLRMLQVDHANVSSVAQWSDADLREVNRLLRVTPAHRQAWVNLGVESAASELLSANGLEGKVRPYRLEDWPELCDAAIRRLIAAGFVPMASLILGLPGETDGHLARTLELVQRWAGLPLVVFPILHAPIRPGRRAPGRADLTGLHWRLLAACYDFNFRRIPPLLADNHRAAGAPRVRRAVIRLAGHVQTAQWKWRLARGARRARP